MARAIDLTGVVITIDDASRKRVELPNGTAFPEWASVGALMAKGPMIDLTINIQEGRPVISGVSIYQGAEDRLEITASLVHDLPLGRIFDLAVSAVAASVLKLQRSTPRERLYHPLPEWLPSTVSADDVADAVRLVSRRGRPVADDDLHRVAAIVRRNSYDPRKQVARELHLADRTASRWIAEARRRGILTEGG
jgi:hypothetical protein